MALLINKATPDGSDQKKFGDDEIRAFKLAVQEIFGIPDNTALGAAVMNVNSSGQMLNLNRILGKMRIGASADDDKLTTGMVINQGADDDFIFVLQSTDVAAPMTTDFTSGTFGVLSKVVGGPGGLRIRGVAETSHSGALVLEGNGASANTTKTSAATPTVIVSGFKSNGAATVAALSNNENLFGVRNGASNVVTIIDGLGNLYLKPGVSGISPDADQDDLVIESAGHGGISLLTADSTAGVQTIAFGDAASNNVGSIVYSHNTNHMAFRATGAEIFRIASLKMFLNDTANSAMSIGLTINGAASSNEVLALKSSSVSHAMTSLTEADTYFYVKRVAASGGGNLGGFSAAGVGLKLQGAVTTVTAERSTSAEAAVMLIGSKQDGSSVTAVGTNGNIVAMANDGLTRWILDGEGDMHLDATSNPNSFDDYNDIELLTAARVSLMPEGSNLRERYGHWITEHADVLAANGIITYNDDGHHFASQKGMQMLTIDTIRQLYARIEKLEERLNGRAD